MARQSLNIASAALVAAAALTLPSAAATGTDDQVSSNVNLGTFQNPSVNVRPRWRYWLPDASVDQSTVASDIKDVVSRGAGGVEFLGFYLYGGINSYGLGGLAESDWATYGWGTDAWKSIQDVGLQATKEAGGIIDLPLGPNQGSGVPAELDSDGLQWDLHPFTVTVPIGGTYNGTLPGWGIGQLVSASTGLVTAFNNATTPEVGTLATSSLVDVTGKVASGGSISLSFPSKASGMYYVLFAYYLVHTDYHEQNTPLLVAHGAPQSMPTSFRQNGSLVWDHFSTSGANLAINYWNDYLLTGDSAKLLKQVGNYVWEDSQEFNPTYAWWTKSLPSLFRANRGYKINKYLPAIIHGIASFGGGSSINPIYQTDELDGGGSHIEDYRQTLTEANGVYLTSVTQWARSIGVQYSAQVAYNLPLDMPALIPYVNAPECESLGFSHNIDGYRQFSGAANLAGKRIISSEEGANFYETYQSTIPSLLWDVKRSFAGGVNAFVFHGLPFTGYYPNTTWPGYSTFDLLFSEMHGPRQPGWDFYQASLIDYTARNSWVLQSGVPKVDLAFYLKATDYYFGTSYEPNDLLDAGYTYGYLSPDNFALPAAHVSNRILAPARQAFKALIVRANDTITVQGATRIAQFARHGLPVVFTGGIPGATFFGYNATGAKYVNETFAQISTLKNVYTVPYDNLAASIAAIGIVPRTQVSSNGRWYTVWREVASSSTTFVYIYNDYSAGLTYPDGYTTGIITFAATGAPFFYDAWTGEETPVTVYTQTASTTTISLALAGDQTVIIGFRQGGSYAPTLSHAPADSVSVSPVTTSNGRSMYTVKSKAGLAPFTLGPWALTVESWAPPSDLFTGSTVLTNSTYTIDSLVSWQDISSNLTYVSGRGYYTTIFKWPPAGGKSATGAIVDLGGIFHTAVLYVNGEQLPPLDVSWAKADIGSCLRKGMNTVEIVVSTTLANALNPVWEELRSSGVGAAGPPPALEDYGLLYPVTVAPYKQQTYYL